MVDEEAEAEDQVDEAIESQEATREAVDDIEEIGTEELSASNNQEDEEELDASLASFLNI